MKKIILLLPSYFLYLAQGLKIIPLKGFLVALSDQTSYSIKHVIFVNVNVELLILQLSFYTIISISNFTDCPLYAEVSLKSHLITFKQIVGVYAWE